MNTTEGLSRFRGASRTLLLVFFVGFLIASYALFPSPTGGGSAWLLLLIGIGGLVVYVALAMWAALQLGKSRHPVFDAVLLLIALASLVILGFAMVYLGLAASSPESFSQPLSKVAAAYFSLTILSTVGFGDIVGTTDTSRAVVMAQMVVDLTLLSLAIQIVTHSVRDAVNRRLSHRTAGADPS